MDRRIGEINEFKAQAWKDALNPNLTFEIAREFIAKHYSRSGDCIMPYHINEAFRTQRNAEANRAELENTLPADPATAQKYLDQMRSIFRSVDAHFEPPASLQTSEEAGVEGI